MEYLYQQFVSGPLAECTGMVILSQLTRLIHSDMDYGGVTVAAMKRFIACWLLIILWIYRILKVVRQSFIKQLTAWMLHGYLWDPSGEFFIIKAVLYYVNLASSSIVGRRV